jgi:hypothetical protein
MTQCRAGLPDLRVMPSAEQSEGFPGGRKSDRRDAPVGATPSPAPAGAPLPPERVRGKQESVSPGVFR